MQLWPSEAPESLHVGEILESDGGEGLMHEVA